MIDNIGCINNTIKVWGGQYVDLLNPDPDTIDLESIAHALSMMCRFGGHAPRFYSVAEHSVLACKIANADCKDNEVLRAVLMHDATEAFVGDMVKPLKVAMPEYRKVEEKVETAVGVRFGIDFHKHAATIKHYDRAMLKAEKIHFWPEDSEEWFGFSEIDERDVKFCEYAPLQARSVFLELAQALELS